MGKLDKIGSCRYYQVDELTHSIPYLVPRAEKLLKTIGRNFQDSLSSKGLSARYKGAEKEETDKLKSVLAEVLQDLRKQKKCYVRYEFKQGCFHITVR